MYGSAGLVRKWGKKLARKLLFYLSIGYFNFWTKEIKMLTGKPKIHRGAINNSLNMYHGNPVGKSKGERYELYLLLH